MVATDYREFKDVLLALRDRTHGCVAHMTDSALARNRDSELSSMPIHMADVGSENFEREFTLQLVQSSCATLSQIDEALQRIENGTYGTCEVCGAKIPKRRLQAVPYASMCVKCAEIEQSKG